MAFCKWCDGKFPNRKLDSNGLCYNCGLIVDSDIKQRGHIIVESNKLIKDSKNLKTRLNRFDLVKTHTKHLKEYEDKGIETITPPPSELLSNYFNDDERDNLIFDWLEIDTAKALDKSKVATTQNIKLREANKGLLKIGEWKQELNDESRLNELEMKLKMYIHEAQLNLYIDTAKKAEFKGQIKKAIDQYQEALFFIKNDSIDDALQDKEIKDIEKKIEELSM